MNLKFEHLVAAAGVLLAFGAVGQSRTPTVSALRPVVATHWLELEFVATKAGARLCPPGVDRQRLNSPRCGDVEPVTAARYLEMLANSCPGLVPVSAHPARAGMHKYMVLGYYLPEGSACPTPAGASRPVF